MMTTPEAAAEFLTLHFNADQLINGLLADPSTLLCDANQFSQSFHFANGVDVATIQKNLCKAARNNSLVMSKVWKLFDMKQLIEELSRLTGASAPTTPQVESPFRSMLKQIQVFLRNANVITRLMQAFSKDMPDIASYLNLMLNTVNSMIQPDANNIGKACDAVVNLIDEVPQFEQARPYLVRIQIVNAIAAKIATNLDELDDFLCELPSMNMSTILSKLTQTDLLDQMVFVDDAEYLAKTPFVCSNMVRDAMLPSIKINNMISTAVSGKYEYCINKLMTSEFAVANDLNLYLGLLSGFRDLLKAESLTSLRPIFEEIIDSLLDQVMVCHYVNIVVILSWCTQLLVIYNICLY